MVLTDISMKSIDICIKNIETFNDINRYLYAFDTNTTNQNNKASIADNR